MSAKHPFGKAARLRRGINAPLDQQGTTPLHQAVELRAYEDVAKLLRVGANPLLANHDGYAPLHLAAVQQDIEMVKLLISGRANLMQRNDKGHTPLDCAILQKAPIGFLEALHAAGAQLSKNPRNSETAFHLAVQADYPALFDYLQEKGIDINEGDFAGNTPLIAAIKKSASTANLPQQLIAAGANPNKATNSGQTPLMEAAIARNIRATKTLLQYPDVAYNIDRFRREFDDASALMLAAQTGELDIIKQLVIKGADVNARDKKNRHSLTLAAHHGHAAAARFLISAGADVAKAKKSKENAAPILHEISDKSFEEILPLLVDAGADIDAVDGSGQTALCRACSRLQGDQISLLLQAGADPNRADEMGNPPLNALIGSASYQYREMVDTVKALLAAGAAPDIIPDRETRLSPLHIAARNGQTGTMRALLEAGAPVNTTAQSHLKNTPLHLAVKKDKCSAVQLLLAYGANLEQTDDQGKSSLHLAIRHNAENTLTWLIEQGRMNLQARDHLGRTPLHTAAVNSREHIVQLLVAAGASTTATDHQGRTPLHAAAENGNEDAISVLCAVMPDINITTTERGETALHLAVKADEPETLEKLLRLGADPSRANKNYLIPLHFAVLDGDAMLVQANIDALLAHNLKIDDYRDRQGNTVLHYAAAKNHTYAAQKLIRAGADLHATNKHGDTPLHFAARLGRAGLIGYLLREKSPDLSLQNNKGETPLDTARYYGHDNVVEAIESFTRQKIPPPKQKNRKPAP